MSERWDALSEARCARRISSDGPDLRRVLLGKTPRYAADRDFDTLHVKLELSVDMARRTVSGTCSTTLRAFADQLRRLRFDACGMRVLSARSSSGALRFTHKDGRLTVSLRAPLRAGEETTVEIRYRVADPKAGLHFVEDGPPQLWSQGQPEDSRWWFPCHDSPRQKSTSEVAVSVPKGFVAVSNGVLLERRAGPRTETFHWRMDRPHALYLVSLAVGRFARLQSRWEDVSIEYYCERGREADAARGFAKTPKAIAFFSEKLGIRYPYEKYAQVAVAEYPGGMENTTCTTQTDACLIDKEAALDTDLDMLVAHELAHQWFGDLVTCADWSHAWLNEGFATYFEVLFTAHDKGDDEADYEMLRNAQAYFHESDHRYRRPVVCSTYKYPWVLFDRHLYEKGAWVLHMLRRDLGDASWWRSLNLYLTRHRDQSVVTEDLAAAIEETTGRNVRPFFDQWLHHAGYPAYEIRLSWDRKAGTAEVSVLQAQRDPSPLFSTPAVFRFSGRGWSRDFTETIDKKEHSFKFRLPGEPLTAEFDPDQAILKKADFRKPLALWVGQLSRARRAVGRIEAAHAVARWGGAEAVRALAGRLRREPFWGAAAEIARALGGIRTEAALEALSAALARERRPKVRRALVEALAESRSPRYERLYASLLRRDRSLHVRAEAARALGALRSPRWLGLLARTLKSRSYFDTVSGGAIQGLAAARERSALAALRRASRPPFRYPARAYALRALARFSPLSGEVVGWVSESVGSNDERISRAAISALGEIGDERALPLLEKTLKDHPDTRVKTYAEEAIARIRGEREGPAKRKI